MSRDVFIERSRLGNVVYEINDGTLRIYGRRELRRIHVVLDLHSLSPRIDLLGRRFYRPIVYSGGLGLLLIAVALAFVFQKKVPVDAVAYYAEISGIVGAVLLAGAIRWIPVLQIARVRNVLGKPMADIIYEREYGTEFEKFVATLHTRIEQSKVPGARPVES